MGDIKRAWLDEFKMFLEVPGEMPPAPLAERVRCEIQARLNPNLAVVFLRLLGLHVVISALTISLCPHFGVQIIPGFQGVATWLMRLGPDVCMLGCGAFFMGCGVFGATWFLSADDLRALTRGAWGIATALTFASAGLLTALGQAMGFVLFAFWAIGGIIAATASLWLANRLRSAMG